MKIFVFLVALSIFEGTRGLLDHAFPYWYTNMVGTADITDYPHHVIVHKWTQIPEDQDTARHSKFCAATLVASNFVLTSASCVRGRTVGHLLLVFLLPKLDKIYNKDNVIGNVVKIISHPGYNASRYHIHDIALIQFKFGKVKPPSRIKSVLMPKNWMSPDTMFEMTGYLFFRDFAYRDGAEFVKFSAQEVTTEECRRNLNIHPREWEELKFWMFCAKDPNIDLSLVAPSDIGAGLIFKHRDGSREIYGVASGLIPYEMTTYGERALTNSRLTSVFTRVSKYKDWMEEMMRDQSAFGRSYNVIKSKVLKTVNSSKLRRS